MFDYEKTLKKLNKFAEYPKRKQEKFIKNLFYNEDLYVWLFDYGRNKDKNIPVITADMVTDLYNALTMPDVLKMIITIIEDEGYDEYTRSAAVFLNSIAEHATDRNNKTADDVRDQLKSGEMSSSEARKIKENLEKYIPLIEKCMKTAKKIIKGDAKTLSKSTNLPKEICYSAMLMVPDTDLIPHNKVQFYLNAVLADIYEKASQNEARLSYGKVKWYLFFSFIFGKNNIADTATAILLEGVNRIDKYKDAPGYDNVHFFWTSLTDFALEQLDRAPEHVRTHMLDLYVKKLDAMFKNNTYDLRVDILKLPSRFNNLIKSVSSYTDKIKEIRKIK